MFFYGRLAMPLSDVSAWRHATSFSVQGVVGRRERFERGKVDDGFEEDESVALLGEGVAERPAALE